MSNLSPNLSWSLFIPFITFIYSPLASAQIVPDKTLGNENSTVRQDTIKNIPSDVIEGGATRGSNLFHSFQQFNINEGRGGYFKNPEAIRNIFGRVTGNDASKIFGTLGVLGDANLFLINPNGIVFGRNARLDINGAFFGSTADSLVFDNNFEFSASNPSAPPLLTVDIPLGVRFRNHNSSGDIESQANLTTGRDLTLQGNNLNLSGSVTAGEDLTLTAENNLTIRDSIDNPFVAFSGNDLLIQGKLVDIFALNNPNSAIFAGNNLTLKSPNALIGDAYYWSGGDFRIEKTDGSLGQLNSPNDPIIRSLGDVLIGAYEGASLHIIAGGSVEITDFVVITGADTEFGLQETITLSNGKTIDIDGKNTPTVDIRAGVNPDSVGMPPFSGSGNDSFFGSNPPSSIATGADINVGTILFSRNPNDSTQKITGDVLLTNQYKPNPNLQGNINLNPSTNPFFQNKAIDTASLDDGGRVFLDSRNNINITGNIFSLAFGQNGRGGEVFINSLANTSINNGLIDVASSQEGNININSQNLILNNGNLQAGILSGLGFETAVGGNIDIQVQDKAIITNNSSISNGVYSGAKGNSGLIKITATGDTIVEIDSVIVSNVSETGEGNSGGIIIETANLILKNGGNIRAATLGKGDSGFINIKANGDIILTSDSSSNQRSFIASSVGEGGEGDSRGIILDTANLILENGGRIDASIVGEGDSGLINIKASEDIFIIGKSSSNQLSSISGQVSETGEGDIGGIMIDTAGNLILENGGTISGNTFGKGNSGLIDIRTSEDIFIIGLSSSIESGVGANDVIEKVNSSGITIKTNNLVLANGGNIRADTSGKGNSGAIEIKANEDIIITGQSSIVSRVNNTGEGNSDGIAIDTVNLLLENGGVITASTLGKGDSGLIDIKASEDIIIRGKSSSNQLTSIESGVGASVVEKGNSDGITITTNNLILTNGGAINANTFGKGNSGPIRIKANTNITLIGDSFNNEPSFIASAVGDTGEGESGGIIIDTANLSLKNGGVINASTFGKGDSGTVNINATDEIIVAGSSNQRSFIASEVDNKGEGDSGGITINTINLTIDNGGTITASSLNTSSLNNGNAGNIVINTNNQITLSGTSFDEFLNREIGGIFAFTQTEGKAGDITVNTSNLQLSDGASIEAFTSGIGDAGDITINSPQIVNIGNNSSIVVETSSSGNPGDITITTDTLNLGQNARLSTTSQEDSSNEIGGSINLNARNLNISGRLGIFAETQSISDAGNLTIQPDNNNPTLNIDFTDNGFISASTISSGNGGSITILAPQTIDISGNGEIKTETSATGKAGNIDISSQQLSLSDGVIINASTSSNGNSGNIQLNGANLTFDNATIQALTTGTGNPGSILLSDGGNNAENINLTNSTISTEIKADGNTETAKLANITIKTNNLNLDNTKILASTEANRDAGNITIVDSQQINLDNNSEITALTKGSGNAGNLQLAVEDIIRIDNGSILNVETQAGGFAGNIDINAPTITIGENAQLSARSRQKAQGNAGNITLNSDRLNVAGELGIFAETEGIADAGNLNINPFNNNPNLEIDFSNQGNISASTSGSGNGGDITINAPQNLEIAGNGTISVITTDSGNAGTIDLLATNISLDRGVNISASTQGSGSAGNINFRADKLILTNEAKISTDTSNSGNGGNINIELEDNLNLDDSQILANTNPDPNSTGKGGNIEINTGNEIDLDNRASITVNSDGTGDGGNIFITGENLSLNSRSFISAETESGQGGDITININKFIRQQNNSFISATAGKAGEGGDGGNITLETQYLIGTGNSDITANAFEGTGGNIDITATGIFRDFSSEITASSQFGEDGVIELDTPETDPSEGLIEFSANVVDANDLIAQNVCRQGEQSEFTVRGKGGLPASPEEYVNSDEIEVDLIAVTSDETSTSTSKQNDESVTSQTEKKIIPARGWVQNEKGELVLVAYANEDSVDRTPDSTNTCSK